jgi:hypothetical protein
MLFVTLKANFNSSTAGIAKIIFGIEPTADIPCLIVKPG